MSSPDIKKINDELEALMLQSKALSSKIGAAKKAGDANAKGLISEKKVLHQTVIAPLEKQLKDLKAGTSAPLTKPIQPRRIETPQAYVENAGPSDKKTPNAIHYVEWHYNLEHQDAWDRYVEKHPSGGIYYTFPFLNAISQAMGHRIFLVFATDECNNIVGCLPIIEQKSALFGHLWTSIALVNYGGVLANNKEVEIALLDEACQQAKQHKVERLEVRGLYERPVDAAPWQTNKDKASMWLALPSNHCSGTLLSQFKAKLRSQIKKGYTDKVTTKIGGKELLKDFYAVFARNMRDLGTPVYGINLFAEILNSLGNKAQIVLVYHDNKPASCAFLIQSGTRMEIPWASTIRDYNQYNLNMVLYWEVLKLACERECDIFDFGRSSIDAPTYKFKKQWGAAPIQHYWLSFEPCKPVSSEVKKVSTDNPKFILLIACWKRLPVWLSKLVGPHIVKYIP